MIKPPKSEARQRLHQSDLVSFVPMSDLGIREKFFSSMEEKPFGKVSGSYTYFADDDVLLAKITPCFENGKLGIARGLVNGVGFGSSEFIVFRPSGELASEFLFYYLSQDGFRDAGQRVMSGAVGHKRVSKEFIENHLIPLPPLAEQKRMVAILDEAFEGIDAAIANTEKNLANAQELLESYLSSVFSRSSQDYPQKPLSDISTFSSGGTPSKRNDTFWCGDIPWVSGRDMKSTQLFDSQLHISVSAVAGSSTRIAPIGSLLILVRGMGLAHGAQVAELMVACAFNQDIKGVHPKSDLVPRYLVFALRHKINSSENILSNAAHGTLKINSEGLKNVLVPIPCIEKQNEIVTAIEALKLGIQHLESIYQRKLLALAELKQSLLQKAFSGALTSEMPDKQQKEAVA
ncbi:MULTISPECIES: restriction endonuclease subunit S [unclassified Marinobacter]|uniref:restriction endonuclease subunit S n=1 Tax=unclassified Marinobacter TaxID=83889 RepID=UPI00200E3B26|nr:MULTISPECIES: restriction endonuclease subunit S [unclassified Marinobacter]MCL1479869.1 restriction endonuclease subunit S [Marinobacter sp.]MCL1484984.1 restriction endonuclease subunit S [Marinobacter sp.]UQG57297.1 restriction endonuclease subunit S [Marinobacter sp. M4C]UQG66101.1 restriction endonuclease subunit S [Marinobacter sp. M2C]